MTTKMILLVEDNCDDEELTLMAFEQCDINLEIKVVRDGAEALDYLFRTNIYAQRQLNDNPALILLDLNLPKIGGLEVLRRLRSHQETRLLPVVILTTSKDEQDLIKGYNFGCNSYVCKPVDYQQFLYATRQLGLYWLGLNEPPPQ